jgi:hypothetical protein
VLTVVVFVVPCRCASVAELILHCKTTMRGIVEKLVKHDAEEVSVSQRLHVA